MSAAVHQIMPLSPDALAEAIARGCGHGRDHRVSANTLRTYCPAHEEDGSGNPSLKVTVRDGKLLIHCQTRICAQNGIIANFKARGLWPDRAQRRRLTLAEFAKAKRLPIEFLPRMRCNPR